MKKSEVIKLLLRISEVNHVYDDLSCRGVILEEERLK